MKTNPLTINHNDKLLIVSPHPDDESIGVGGLLSLYGKQCSVYVMTDGRYGNPQYSPLDMMDIREKELVSSMELAGVTKLKTMPVEDGKLINFAEAFDDIRMNDFDLVFVPNPNDDHSDHTACYKYVVEIIKKKELRNIRVYMYEVHNPLGDVDYHLDITDVISSKKRMIECYKSQLEMHSYDDQVIKLAEYRGYQNERDGRYLEAYKRIDAFASKEITGGIETELAKYKSFTRLFRKWLSCDNNVGDISGYLLNRGFANVAIYGYGIIGQTLYRQLEKTVCRVKYIIDKNEGIKCEIKKYSEIDNLEYVDLVIITVVLDVESIKKEIEEKSAMKCVGIDELISDVEKYQ